MHELIEYGYDEIEPSNTRGGNKIIYGIVDKQSGNYIYESGYYIFTWLEIYFRLKRVHSAQPTQFAFELKLLFFYIFIFLALSNFPLEMNKMQL